MTNHPERSDEEDFIEDMQHAFPEPDEEFSSEPTPIRQCGVDSHEGCSSCE